MNINERRSELIELLHDKEYRDAFTRASLEVGLPSQIRILREQRGWTQKKLGDVAEMAQESISRIEDPARGSVNNIRTLLRLASALDVGLMVKFVSFSEMAERKLKLSLESLEVKSFADEPYFQEGTLPIVEEQQQYTTISTTLAANEEFTTTHAISREDEGILNFSPDVVLDAA